MNRSGRKAGDGDVHELRIDDRNIQSFIVRNGEKDGYLGATIATAHHKEWRQVAQVDVTFSTADVTKL